MPVDQGLRSRLQRRLRELPILPTAITSLMTLDRTDDDYFENLVELVESEPNFATRLLAVSNSAASAPRTPVTTIRSAVTRLGSSTANDLVTALGVTRVFVPQDQWEKSLWRHSLQVADSTRALAIAAADARLKPDECHAAGLLHDLGRFVMFQEAPDTLREVDEGGWDDPRSLIDYERSICGLTHTEIAEAACRQWGLPDNISEVAIRHHEPSDPRPNTSPIDMIVDLVRFADIALFPFALGGQIDLSDEWVEAKLLPRLPPFIELSPGALADLVVESANHANATAAALGL